jgi:hypothetical protein
MGTMLQLSSRRKIGVGCYLMTRWWSWWTSVKNYVRNLFGDRPGLACAYVLFYQQTTPEAVWREQEQDSMAAIRSSGAQGPDHWCERFYGDAELEPCKDHHPMMAL